MKLSELKHHQKISKNAEDIWGWGTPAGQARSVRRATLLKKTGRLQPGHRVLEIGCGTGIFSVQFAETGIQLVSIDICQELLDQAKNKTSSVDFKIDDAENLSFSDNTFDTVIASSVLHHLDVARTLREILRVLKPGGTLALAEPNMLNPQIMVQKNVPWIKRAMGDSEDETAFFRWSIRHQLTKAGFENARATPFDFLHPLVPKATIRLAQKMSDILETIPVLREIAGSLLIQATKPLHRPAPTISPRETAEKSFLTRLVGSLKVSNVAEVDLNSPDAALAHREQIQSKKFLRRLYADFYQAFCREAKAVQSLSGDIVELGSGAGFLKDLIPQITTSDVLPMPFVDKVIFADNLPYAEEGLKGIFAMNVLHHLADPAAFFKEADRCLALGGRIVLIEPHCSWWGRFVYKHLHYEPFDMETPEWTHPDRGRLETANGALPHIIFERDRALFDRRFPRLSVRSRSYSTVFCYLLSGGVSWPAMVPAFSYPLFRALDRFLARAHRLFPIFQTIVIEKI